MLIRMNARITTLCLAILVGACAKNVDLSTEFPSTPFRSLQGVSLGMKARDLPLARPDANFAPYRGYSEMIDTVWIGYQFPAGSVSASGLKERARLARIDAHISKPSMAAALDAWHHAVASVMLTSGSPLRCENILGISPGVRTIWKSAGVWLQISAREPHPSVSDTTTDRIVFTVSTKDPVSVHPMEIEETPCSDVL